MNDLDQKSLDGFLSAIEANLAAYRHASFSYLALRKGSLFEITEGRLFLNVVPTPAPSQIFQSENIRAGMFRLGEMKFSPKEAIHLLVSGSMRTPQGELSFPSEQGGGPSLTFIPFHQDGIPGQSRQMQLSISGRRRERVDSLSMDWELRASSTPFDGIQDLCNEYSIGLFSGDFLHVEVVAFNVAAISNDSAVDGRKAVFGINLAEGLDSEKASIGYRVFEKNRVVKRGSVLGAALKWTKIDHVQHGRGDIEVPAGAVVHCVACYAGVAQNFYWILDSKTAPNPFRSVHQAFDNGLEVLQELIEKAHNKGSNARELETAVSWLMWILGFSTTHIGGTKKTEDAPDLIASTPMGNLLVVECTTGILKEDNKLAHLVERTEKVRGSLVSSGNQHLRVLPIIVTTRTREEVRTDLEQAKRLGVLVLTREDFPALINRTIAFPDPNRLYAEAEQSVRRSQNSPLLPGL